MFDFIFNLFGDFFLLKLGLLILIGIYIPFLLVVLKQTQAMTKVIQYTSASYIITIIALLNLVFGILLFVTALVIL
jgi:hypothetical protein